MPYFPKNQLSVECLKSKFYDIICRVGPIGDLNSLAYTVKAKIIKQWIFAKTDGSIGSNEAKDSVEECADESVDDIVKIGVHVKLKKSKEVLTSKSLELIQKAN